MQVMFGHVVRLYFTFISNSSDALPVYDARIMSATARTYPLESM